jgi:hypothetical protein
VPDLSPDPAPDLARRTRSGPGRLLIAGYGLLGIAATSRSAVQISTRFDEAPLAYLLSAVAAALYLVITGSLLIGTRRARAVVRALLGIELGGVLIVGLLTVVDRGDFPDQTVWSFFGAGYLLLPLVLPILGLVWLRRTEPTEGGGDGPSQGV